MVIQRRNGVALIAAILLASAGCKRFPAGLSQQSKQAEGHASFAASPARKIYPYSLISGGVLSASEFAQRRSREAILALHYQDIGPTVERVVLDRDRMLYAPYRVGDAIYWTRKPILVHSGEVVFTDGSNLVRGRCGNRLSMRAQGPVRQFEPPALATDEHFDQANNLDPPDLPLAFERPGLPNLPDVAPPEDPRAVDVKEPVRTMPDSPFAMAYFGSAPAILLAPKRKKTADPSTPSGSPGAELISAPEAATGWYFCGGMALLAIFTWGRRARGLRLLTASTRLT